MVSNFKKFILRKILVVTVLLIPCAAFTMEKPLKESSGLAQPKKETMLRVTTAKIILADYPLIKKDFPHLQSKSNQEIDDWLLEHTAYISEAQTKQQTVNSKISTTAIGTGQKTAFRPKGYGRAVVFDTGSGLIDAKGVGAARPKQFSHSNGLSTLGEDIREYLYQKLVQKIFEHSKSGEETVECYAVIDYGFDVIHQDGSKSPAGAVLRQAHKRSKKPYSILSAKASLRIENLLRQYGVTSAGARYATEKPAINLQGSPSGAVIDFGAFVVLESFHKPSYYGYYNIGEPLRESKNMQPYAEYRIPLSLWGTPPGKAIDPKSDYPWIWSHELADNLRKGTAQRVDVEQHIHNLLDPVEKIFLQNPYKTPALTCNQALAKASVIEK